MLRARTIHVATTSAPITPTRRPPSTDARATTAMRPADVAGISMPWIRSHAAIVIAITTSPSAAARRLRRVVGGAIIGTSK
jgi:hypothetical protein